MPEDSGNQPIGSDRDRGGDRSLWEAAARAQEAAALGKTDDERTYEQAAARIETIIRRLDSGEAGLRETLDLVSEGRELVEFCASELEAVGRGLEELELDALISRLEGAPPRAEGEAPGGAGRPGT